MAMPSLCSPRSQPEVSDGVPDDPLARAGAIGLRESGEIAAGRGIGRRTQLKSLLLLDTAIGRDVVRGNAGVANSALPRGGNSGI